MTTDSERIDQLERRITRLETAVQLLGSKRNIAFGFDEAPEEQMDNVESRVLDLVRFGRKVEAIKSYRELTGKGMKEAKKYVEDLEKRIKRGEL